MYCLTRSPEVWDQGVGIAMLPLKGQAKHLFLGYLLASGISWPVGALTPICTWYSPSVTISVCKFPLFIRIPVVWISSPPYSIMTLPSLFHLQWPYSPCFQIRSHFEILGVETSTYKFWGGHNSTQIKAPGVYWVWRQWWEAKWYIFISVFLCVRKLMCSSRSFRKMYLVVVGNSNWRGNIT